MKFEFEIDNNDLFDEDCIDEYSVASFKYMLQNKVVATIVDKLLHRNFYDDENWDKMVNAEISKIIKENKDDIISAVIDKVSNTISKKKEIVAITPKASEWVKADKENEEYFMKLIDKAIANRFSK